MTRVAQSAALRAAAHRCTAVLASGLKRVGRRLQRRRCERLCAREADPFVLRRGLIVTTFYDVEGDYARAGQTANEVEAIGRILEIERRHGIRSTYNVVARFARDVPEVVAAVRRAGHEIASHSYDHSILSRLAPAALVDNVRRTRQTFRELGIEISGHRSPQSDWNDGLLGALLDHGFVWSAENGNEPHPYRIRCARGRELWRFPVADDDWSYEADGLSPGAMLQRWRNRILAAFGARKHVALGFHAWVESPRSRLAALDEFFGWLVEQDGVEVMPFGDALKLASRLEPREPAFAHG